MCVKSCIARDGIGIPSSCAGVVLPLTSRGPVTFGKTGTPKGKGTTTEDITCMGGASERGPKAE